MCGDLLFTLNLILLAKGYGIYRRTIRSASMRKIAAFMTVYFIVYMLVLVRELIGRIEPADCSRGLHRAQWLVLAARAR